MPPLQRILQKATQKMSLLTSDLLFAIGWRSADHIFSKPGKCILVYHGLDQKGDKSLNGRFISAAEFDTHIRFLSDHVQMVSLDDYCQKTFDTSQFAVAITFDDGYQNNARYALPVLEKYAVPAAIFLTSAAERNAEWLWMDFLDTATRLGPVKMEIDGHLFTKKRWRHTRYYEDEKGRKLVDWARYSTWTFVLKMEAAFQTAGAWANAGEISEYWQLLAVPDIKKLAAHPCITIGAHGHTHQDMAVLSYANATAELQQCKLFLEKITGQTIHHLAYPFGTYNRELVDFAEKLGFLQQFSTGYLFPEDQDDPRLHKRLVINPYISPNNQWLAVKNGHY